MLNTMKQSVISFSGTKSIVDPKWRQRKILYNSRTVFFGGGDPSSFMQECILFSYIQKGSKADKLGKSAIARKRYKNSDTAIATAKITTLSRHCCRVPSSGN